MTLTQDINEKVIIIAGMPRAGTTWLYSLLGDHPEIELPTIKETNFYSLNYDRNDNWYLSLFENIMNNGHVSYDISPFYFLDDNFLSNYSRSKSEQKVILLLREPNKWVESMYWQVKSFDYSLGDFNDFIQNHNLKFEGKSINLKLNDFDFLQRVNDFSKILGDKLLIIDFEMIQRNPVEVLNLIEEFSGLQHYFTEQNTSKEAVNASSSKTSFIAYLSTLAWFRNLVLFIFPHSLVHRIRNVLIYNKPTANNNSFPDNQFPKDLFKKNVFRQKWYKKG